MAAINVHVRKVMNLTVDSRNYAQIWMSAQKERQVVRKSVLIALEVLLVHVEQVM